MLRVEEQQYIDSIYISGVGNSCGIYVRVEFWNIGKLTDVMTIGAKKSWVEIDIAVTSRQVALH